MRFASSVQTVGTHSFTAGNLQSIAVTSSFVDSLSPSSSLVHQSIYSIELSYKDFGSNARSFAVQSNIEFDTITDAPSILLPQSQTRFKVSFQLRFDMSEIALGNTLILSITPAW